MQGVKRNKPHNFSLTGFMKLVRFNNLLIIVLAQYMAGVFLIGRPQTMLERLLDPNLFWLSLSTVFLAAAGYIINDYYDVKIDVINKPERVVVDRVLKRRVALVAHGLLNILGITIGIALSYKIGIIHFFTAFLLWFYSNQLKRLPAIGNIVVALLTGASLAILAVYYKENEMLIYTYSIYAFSITLIREIVKDMEDIKGDASFGCRTLPIIWGIRKTKQLIYLLTAVFIAVLFTLTGILPNVLVGYFFLLLLIPISWFLIRLIRADTSKEFEYLSNICKFIMMLGIISMCFVSL